MTLFERADAALLPGFERRKVSVNGRTILALTAGEGPPVLMLHGDPQTHLCWHHVAPRLAQRFSVVLTDLRGRGESDKPNADTDATVYSKREMAAEQRAVMRALGHDKFALVGHDRGARVARRLALDHPQSVTRLAVMDIVPALNFYEGMTAEVAQEYFYFSFLTQDRPLPERLISGDPEAFMRDILFGLAQPVAAPYAQHALNAYLTASTSPEAIAAICACFRSGFHIDRVHDEQDRRHGRKITCSTLVMWGADGVVGRHFDLEAVWREWCADPRFLPMPCGHFIPEERPDETFAALDRFLADPA